MSPFFCTLRQGLRRASWLLLFVAGLFVYPAQVAWQTNSAANEAAASAAANALDKPNATPADVLSAAAHAASIVRAQVVSPTYLFSKLSIAIGVFCLINLLAWAALNMVLPVLPNWAVGRYGTADNATAVGLAAPVVGFKRTFLSLSAEGRILVYFLGFGLQLLAAGLGVWAAFTIQ